MNAFLRTRIALIPLLAMFGATPLHAADPSAERAPTTGVQVAEVQAPASTLAIDCARPALPSQRAVGELVGQHNVGQVYATRTRLMAEVRRACQREGAAKVLVSLPPQRKTQGYAVQRPAR